jgi:hypothetical protein
MPDYIGQIDWWLKDNPRCLWPEQKTRFEVFNPVYEFRRWFQFPSTGRRAGLGHMSFEQTGPVVPVRSRSEDPRAQYSAAKHRGWFPVASVERDFTDRSLAGYRHHDPHSIKDFPEYSTPSNVQIRWYPPDTPDNLRIISAIIRTSEGDVTMVHEPTGGVMQAEIEPKVQGTEVTWYIAVTYNAAAPGDPDDIITIFEPKNPDDRPDFPPLVPTTPYSFVFFSHVLGPYAQGFPELITRLGQWDDVPPASLGGLRKGTETWEFNSLEDIQPEHINMARFLLNDMGSRSQHNPDWRGDSAGCCFHIPIVWRWSGSNVHWQYVRGGKGGVHSAQPLHNLDAVEPELAGSTIARNSWRGTPTVFKSDPFGLGDSQGYNYGGNESWLTHYADVWNDGAGGSHFEPGLLYDRGEQAGLQPGDVIDAVHLWEIIDAVDYLLAAGLWNTRPISSTRMSPMRTQHYACSWSERVPDYEDPPHQPESDFCREQCCDYCPPDGTMADCVAFGAPSWSECQGSNQRCNFGENRHQECTDVSGLKYTLIFARCNSLWTSWLVPGQEGAVYYSCSDGDTGGLGIRCHLDEVVQGWTAFLCGPSRAQSQPGLIGGNPDHDHGNWIRKNHRLASGVNPTGSMPSYGNSFQYARACSYDTGNPAPHIALDFESVHAVRWDGLVSGVWWRALDIDCPTWMIGAEWPPIPGLEFDEDGVSVCDEDTIITWRPGFPDEMPPRYTDWACYANDSLWPYCNDRNSFVNIDLNKIDGVPRLKPFNMSALGGVDPDVPEWSECPCDTDPSPSAGDICELLPL